MNTSVSDDNWVHGTIVVFIVATVISDVVPFEQFLIRTAVMGYNNFTVV